MLVAPPPPSLPRQARRGQTLALAACNTTPMRVSCLAALCVASLTVRIMAYASWHTSCHTPCRAPAATHLGSEAHVAQHAPSSPSLPLLRSLRSRCPSGCLGGLEQACLLTASACLKRIHPLPHTRLSVVSVLPCTCTCILDTPRASCPTCRVPLGRSHVVCGMWLPRQGRTARARTKTPVFLLTSPRCPNSKSFCGLDRPMSQRARESARPRARARARERERERERERDRQRERERERER